MPIQKLTLQACIAGVILTSSTLVSADSSSWTGSYAVDDQCFCGGSIGQNLDSMIVPTPIGGQSVAQVCERLGDGPTLKKVDGKFNFTVYNDRQCGHGPTADSSADQSCLGHLGTEGEDCAPKGPEWDLVRAYQSNGLDDSDTLVAAAIVTGGSRHIKPPRAIVDTQATLDKGAEAEVKTYEAAGATPVEKIAEVRKNSTKLPEVVETPEQLRARQLVHLAEARERAQQRIDEQRATANASVLTDEANSVEATAELITESVVAKKVEAEALTAKPTIAAASSADTAIQAQTQLTAFQVPRALSRGSNDFDFVEGSPVQHDFGGAGLRVTASKSSHNLIQYVLRATAVEDYQEASVGIGAFVTPANLSRVTLMAKAGVETGNFQFSDDLLTTDLSGTGAFVELASRFAVTQKFKLQGGLGYSSFFEGDLIGFGEALFNITNKLDFSSRFEAGDNDLIGFGIRYHY